MRAFKILLNGHDEGIFKAINAQAALAQFSDYAERAAVEAGFVNLEALIANAGETFPPQVVTKEVNPHAPGSYEATYWRIGRNHGREKEIPGFPHIEPYMDGYRAGGE